MYSIQRWHWRLLLLMTILLLLLLTGRKSFEMQQWQDAILWKKRGFQSYQQFYEQQNLRLFRNVMYWFCQITMVICQITIVGETGTLTLSANLLPVFSSLSLPVDVKARLTGRIKEHHQHRNNALTHSLLLNHFGSQHWLWTDIRLLHICNMQCFIFTSL